VDVFAAANFGFISFSREGLYRNGVSPLISIGKSNVERFTLYGFKSGLTYKFNGRNYFFINGAIGQEAPTLDNTLISPRSNNRTVSNPVGQKYSSMEGGYLLRTPYTKARIVGYATDVKDATYIQRFYSDELNSFINYVLEGIDTRFTGAELALEFKLSSALSAKGVAAVGQSFYTSRPTVTIYNENDTSFVSTRREAYLKNYYLGVGPQSAYSLSLSYRSRQFWYGTLSFNYFDRNYVDVAPDKRTPEAVTGIEPGTIQWHQVLDQERLPSAFVFDVFLGKSLLLSKHYRFLPRNTFLYFNVGINNLLDNKNIIIDGAEQLRYQNDSPGLFSNKYVYGLGRNYFISLTLKL
jgi:hypothetical protein